MMSKIAVSIVEYNTKDLLKNCLNSIFNYKWINDIEVLVVDNDSKDESVEMVKKQFPKVSLIENKKNVGFGAGHNLSFKKIKADYYVILNSDALLEEFVLDEMVKFMEDNPSCGVSSCKVLGFDEKLQPNGGDLPFGVSLLGWLFNLETIGIKIPAFHREDEGYYRKPHSVGWVSGNFMIIRKKVLEKIGMFNESFFMYFEDVEFCYRVSKGGFSVMINPDVSIQHLSGGSLDDPKFSQWSGEMRGLIQFYQQQSGFAVAFFIRIMVYVSLILRIISFALVGKLSYSLIYGKVIINI